MSLQDSIALFYYGMLVNCLIFFGGLIYEKYNKPAEHVPENYLKFEDPEVVEAIYNFKPSRIQAPDIVLKLQIAITTGLF